MGGSSSFAALRFTLFSFAVSAALVTTFCCLYDASTGKGAWPEPFESYSCGMRNVFLLLSGGHWDLFADKELNKQYLAATSGYWAMALIATTLDLFPKYFLKYKAQGNRSYFTVREWIEAVGVSQLNLHLIAPMVSIPLMVLSKKNDARLREEDPWAWQEEIPKFAACGFVVDFWFYWTHRAIHHPLLYKRIHKFHHRFKAPTSVASMYANPLEFAIGNQLGVVLGPFLTGCHPYTAYFWITNALFSTGASHSGYTFFDCQTHDWHHEHFDYQFGVMGVWDSLCGTGFEGSERHMKMLKKRKA